MAYVAAIYLGLFITCIGYSRLLDWLHRRYPERYIEYLWVTVVVGNVLIGVAFLLIAWLLPPTLWWVYPAHLVGLNVAAGLPVIFWQINDGWRRRDEELNRRETNGRR